MAKSIKLRANYVSTSRAGKYERKVNGNKNQTNNNVNSMFFKEEPSINIDV